MISFYSGLFFLICHTFTRIFIKFFKAKLKIFNKLVKNENIKFPPKPIPCFTFINTFLLVFYVMTDWWWFLDSLIFWWLLSCSWLSDDCSAVPWIPEFQLYQMTVDAMETFLIPLSFPDNRCIPSNKNNLLHNKSEERKILSEEKGLIEYELLCGKNYCF